jgi:hypothetical protein
MLMDENSSMVAELLLVWQVAKGLEAVIGLLVGDEEDQAQEFAVDAARGRHACRLERHYDCVVRGCDTGES